MDRIQLRRDTSANWASANPILLEGEPGYETDTKLRKIGDGVSAWNDLPYLKAEGIAQELGNSENLTISQDLFTKLHNEGYKFAGIANLDTVLQNVTADSKIYYITNTPGVYTNFNNLIVADGEIAFFCYNGSWGKVALEDVAMESMIEEKIAELESEAKILTSYNFFSDESKLSNGYINPDGILASNPECILTDYIHVKVGQKWRYEGRSGDTHIAVWGFAGAMKIPIVEGIRELMAVDFTIPDGVERIRAWSWKDAPTKSLLCKDTMAFKALQLSLSQEENIVELQKNSSKKIPIGKNLFNLAETFDGYYVDYSTGKWFVNAEFFVSEYIPIKPNTSYFKN